MCAHQEVEDRQLPGHWGDLIKGANNASAIGTLVERTTRLVLLVLLPHPNPATAAHVLQAFSDKAQRNSKPYAPEPDLRQGRGDGRARQAHREHGYEGVLQTPTALWQRGTNENTTGLLRRYFPKGTDLALHRSSSMPWPISSMGVPG